MMAPGMVADELRQLGVRLDVWPRHFLGGNCARPQQRRRKPSGKSNAIDHGTQVRLVRIVRAIEVMEIDQRWLRWISRLQLHHASAVAGMRLQNAPGQPIAVLGNLARIAWKVAPERRQKRHYE